MADQTTVPQDTPVQPAQNAAKKSPLDILEEILKEADAKGDASPGNPDQTGALDPASAAPGETPVAAAAPTAETDPAVQAQIAAQQELQRQQDEVALQQQIEALKTIADTPQYQAAQEQQQAEQAIHDQEEADRESNEIRQLQHTKIPVDQPNQ